MEKIEKISKLAKDVLSVSRNTLVINLRFMDKAISMLDVQESLLIKDVSVNGKLIVYNPVFILKAFSRERELVPRMYLHMILHCVYQHFWIGTGANKDYWDLACDIAVEQTINDMDLDSVRTSSSELQASVINSFKKKVKYITADMLYRYFLRIQLSDKELKRLKKLFSQDDHALWYSPPIKAQGNEGSERRRDMQLDAPHNSQTSSNSQADDGSPQEAINLQ